jgi:HEAT repeat protein
LPALRELVDGPDPILRIVGYWGVARIEPDNTQAVSQAIEYLTDVLKRDEPLVRQAAVQALVEMPDASESVMPALVSLLGDDDQVVAGRAMQGLAAVGAKAAPKLAEALEVKETRANAARALAMMGEEADEVADNLAAQLKDEDPEFRRLAIFAVAAVGPKADEAVPELIEALSDQDEEVRTAACYALGKVGPGAKDATDTLKKNLNSDDMHIRRASTWALLKIHPGNKQLTEMAVPVLIDALTDDRDLVRYEAATALGEIGPDAASAVPELHKLSEDDNPEIRAAATESIKQIEN